MPEKVSSFGSVKGKYGGSLNERLIARINYLLHRLHPDKVALLGVPDSELDYYKARMEYITKWLYSIKNSIKQSPKVDYTNSISWKQVERWAIRTESRKNTLLVRQMYLFCQDWNSQQPFISDNYPVYNISLLELREIPQQIRVFVKNHELSLREYPTELIEMSNLFEFACNSTAEYNTEHTDLIKKATKLIHGLVHLNIETINVISYLEICLTFCLTKLFAPEALSEFVLRLGQNIKIEQINIRSKTFGWFSKLMYDLIDENEAKNDFGKAA